MSTRNALEKYRQKRKFEETTGLFYNEKEYIDLYIIKDISLDENTLQISKQELIEYIDKYQVNHAVVTNTNRENIEY